MKNKKTDRQNDKETGGNIFKNLRTIFGRFWGKNKSLKGKFFILFLQNAIYFPISHACIPISESTTVYTTMK